MLRGNWHVHEDTSNFQTMSRWSGILLTCLQKIVRVTLVEFGEQHAKQTYWMGKSLACLLWGVACIGYFQRMLWGNCAACQACPQRCYEETAFVQFTLSLADSVVVLRLTVCGAWTHGISRIVAVLLISGLRLRK